MILTQEHEIEFDEYRYIPYMKITKYYSNAPSIKRALVIDFERESIEIHNTKTGTSLLNLMLYDMPIDIIKSGLELFDRKSIMEIAQENINPELTFWLEVKVYDLEGHKHVFKVNPMEENNPIISILRWINKEYGDVLAIQVFFKDM